MSQILRNMATMQSNRFPPDTKIPMGRIATPEDVVRATFFLASDDAAYFTGQSINVAGGQIM